MKRQSLVIGAVLMTAGLMLAYTATAHAKGSGHGGGHGGHGHGGSHHSGASHNHGGIHNGHANGHVHNVAHAHGTGYFRGRGYNGWTRYSWFPGYRCYGYYSPDDSLWYYWYGPGNRYLPVSEMASYPPDNSVNAPPSLPPGAVEVSY